MLLIIKKPTNCTQKAYHTHTHTNIIIYIYMLYGISLLFSYYSQTTNNYKWKVPARISSHCPSSTPVVTICTMCCKVQRLHLALTFQSCFSYGFFQGHCLTGLCSRIGELRPFVPCVSQLNDNRQVCVLRNPDVYFRFINSAAIPYYEAVY